MPGCPQLNDTGPYHLIIVIPYSELTRGDTALRLVEEYEKSVASHDESGILKRLADLDQRIKSGRVDKKLGFELFLLSMNA